MFSMKFRCTKFFLYDENVKSKIIFLLYKVLTVRVRVGGIEHRQPGATPPSLTVHMSTPSVYAQWVKSMRAKDALFHRYQGAALFPIKKDTFLMLILAMRVNENYVYKTVRDIFANSLCHQVKFKRYGGDPKEEYGDSRIVLRFLLRKFGNQVDKVQGWVG